MLLRKPTKTRLGLSILEIQQREDASGKTSHISKRWNIAENSRTSECENGKQSDNRVEKGRAVNWRELYLDAICPNQALQI